MPKCILVAHDFSCRGNASLGIVIPTLNAFGIEVVSLPTAILSSTTDIDDNPIVLNTTEFMEETVARWREQSIKIKFDAIYTGWIGDPDQVAIISKICRKMRHKEALIFIDPVLGDKGQLYPCQEEMVKPMRNLAKLANFITPNPTEATLLIGKEPGDFGINEDGTISTQGARELVIALSSKYPDALVIIKSVVEDNQIGVCVHFTPENTDPLKSSVTKIILGDLVNKSSVGGTGDLFASLLIGNWLDLVKPDTPLIQRITIIISIVKTLSRIMAKSEGDLPFRDLLQVNLKG